MDDENVDGELYEHFHFIADPGQELMRIDKWLMHKIAHASRTKIQAAIEAECVLVNDKIIKSNYKIKPKDSVKIYWHTPPRDTEIIPENIPLELVLDDEYIAIINKPAGMVVHPGYNNYTGTLVNALAYHYKELPQKNTTHRPGLVHRIDKDTSGLIVIGKNEYALQFLAKQFFEHSIDRKYIALVWGNLENTSGTVSGYIGRDTKDRRVMKIYDDENKGKWSVTHYKLIQDFYFCSLIECTLETGRTHQIRAHMASIGHPLFNDEMYGGSTIKKGSALPKFSQFIENAFALMPRQALHAAELGFIHPQSKEKIFLQSPLPNDFAAVIEKIKSYTKMV